MKIQESLFQALSLSTTDLTKKSRTSSTGPSENVTDSYVSAADLSFIEKEAFQVINAIVSDFKNTVDRLFNDNQNIIFPDIQIQLPDKSAIPMSEHAILMLFAPIKEEAPENPVKIFLSFKADKSSSKTSVSAQFVGKVIEEAKQVINLPAGGKGVSTAQDIKEKDVDIGSGKYGFVIKFSYLPYASGMEPEKTPQLNTVPSTQRDVITQAPELANTYHVSGKVIDSQYLNLLFLRDGKENEVFEKLSVFISDVSTGPAQAEVDEANGILQEDRVGTQIENIANTIEPKKTRIELPFQSACEENKYIVASLDLQKNKDEVILVITESVKKSNGATGSQEGDLKGTILNTGSDQGELKSSPMAGLPISLADNDVIVANTVRFVDLLNTLFNADATADEMLDKKAPDGTAALEVSSEKLHLLQMRSPEVQAAVQNVVKKVFSEFEDLPNTESIGLFLEKNGSFRVETSILFSQLTSNKEETINVMKEFGSALSERINYFVHPFAGAYLDDRDVLRLKASQKNEGASLPDKELSKEQSNLEKRLNELKLLIERSRLLTEWFTGNENVPTDDPKEISWST